MTRGPLWALALVAAAGLYSAGTVPGAQAQNATGEAKKGKILFEQTYRCYACHGYMGEAGSPRLVPMSRTQEQFVTYVRKPASAAMPAFSDVSTQDLQDVYAYIKALRPDSPAVESIPLLRDLLQQIMKAKEARD